MNQYSRYPTLAVFALITACTFLSINCVAQSSSRMSAFTTCVNSEGEFGLCTQHSKDLAWGYSAYEQGRSASLFVGSVDPGTEEQQCSQAPTPSSLELRLSNSDLAIGDRIYFDDFIVEAYDENGGFIPEVPIMIYFLSQDGMIETDANWDYVELISYGISEFFAENYCSESFGTRGVIGQVRAAIIP